MRKSYVIKVIGNFPDISKSDFSRRFVKKLRGRAVIFSEAIGDSETRNLHEFFNCKKYPADRACEVLKTVLKHKAVMSAELLCWGELGVN
jgi:hypothetical protein